MWAQVRKGSFYVEPSISIRRLGNTWVLPAFTVDKKRAQRNSYIIPIIPINLKFSAPTAICIIRELMNLVDSRASINFRYSEIETVLRKI